MRQRALVLCLAALAGTAPAAAQATFPPGPWALDIRGVTGPVPEETVFYPTLAPTALVPTRGFGVDVGGHVYLFNLGASRMGLGLSALNVRAVTNPPPAPAPSPGSSTASPQGQSVQVDVRLLAPQVSLNFGTRNGWSYVSAGAGVAEVVTRTAGVGAARRASDRLNALNLGGGARWFFLSHLAFGFDVRLHRIAAGVAGPIEASTPPAPVGSDVIEVAEPAPLPPTPGKMILIVGIGLSVR